MKINELIHDFEIFTTNEENEVLESMSGTMPIETYTEREQKIIENLIRKSLVQKIQKDKDTVLVRKNERQ